MAFLNDREKHTLALVCDTLTPALIAEQDDDSLLFRLSAADIQVSELLENTLQNVINETEQRDLKKFLAWLENPFLNGLVKRSWKPFSRLDLEARTEILRAWANSPVEIARRAFQSVKRLSLFFFYAAMPEGKPNPTWTVFAYDAPPEPPKNSPKSIQVFPITKATTLDADVLVIGSGAGGGVVAGELSKAGFSVIVAEKGGYYAEGDFHGHEVESNLALFEKFGALTTADISMTVLAGSSLGGGTTINWMTSLRLPDYVREEWANDYGFADAATHDFEISMDTVAQRINVNIHESHANPQNTLLEKAGRLLGYKTDIIPRNVKGCEECGFCVYGCVFGAKQSTVKTYLQDAYECGAKIIVNAHVDRIIHERGVVKGAYVTVHDNEITYQVYVRAKVVVIAAGAIHTPALLMRSGLTNPNLGNHLHLHPTVPTFAFYDEPTMSWRGPHQSRLINEFVNLDRRGYGIWLETAPMHPGFAALALPWQSGRQHKHLMQHYKFLTNNIVLTRDYYGGKVKLDADGQPVLHYKLHPYDAQHMMRGMIEALRLHYATQAKEIMSPHNRYLRYQAGSSEKFEDFLTTVQRHGFHPNAYALFSAHQMSTARIGKDSTQGAIKPTGETYEVKNLFVADSSVFPTACGVNPMLTIMTTAHLITQHIKGVL